MSGLEKLSEIGTKVEGMRSMVVELDSANAPIERLIQQQDEVFAKVNRLTGMFSVTPNAAPLSNSSDQSQGKSSHNSPDRDVLSLVVEGTSLVRSLGEFEGPLEESKTEVQAACTNIADIANNLKDLYSWLTQALTSVTVLLRDFIQCVPVLLAEIRRFFVPTGFRAMFMQTSLETQNLLFNMEGLKSMAVIPDQMEKAVRSVVTESNSARTVHLIKSKIEAAVDIPSRLAAKLKQTCSELPPKILKAARDALHMWAEMMVESGIRDKMDGVVGLAVGEGFAAVVTDLLPFGYNSKQNIALAKPKVSDGPSKLPGLAGGTIGAASGMFKSFY
jgi:hypothetical protein